METDETIRYILSTYDLAEPLKERIAFIAKDRLEDRCLTGFDDQYRYIAHLVERFTLARGQPATVSLDAAVSSDSETPRYAFIAAPTTAEPPADADWEQAAGPAESERMFTELRKAITGPQYRFVQELLRDSRGYELLRPSYVARNKKKIRRRLDALARKHQLNGRIIFPRRPIRSVRFEPLEIRYGNRTGIGENPLGYYRQHWHVYRGLCRKQLAVVDQSLYKALRARGQLDLAIPDWYRRRKQRVH